MLVNAVNLNDFDFGRNRELSEISKLKTSLALSVYYSEK